MRDHSKKKKKKLKISFLTFHKSFFCANRHAKKWVTTLSYNPEPFLAVKDDMVFICQLSADVSEPELTQRCCDYAINLMQVSTVAYAKQAGFYNLYQFT